MFTCIAYLVQILIAKKLVFIKRALLENRLKFYNEYGTKKVARVFRA
jgi:hypothetical protein